MLFRSDRSRPQRSEGWAERRRFDLLKPSGHVSEVGTFQGTRAAAPPEAGFAFFIAFFILFFVVIAFFCLINHTAAVAVALIGHRLEVSHSGPSQLPPGQVLLPLHAG